jgi:hypothetical protein
MVGGDCWWISRVDLEIWSSLGGRGREVSPCFVLIFVSCSFSFELRVDYGARSHMTAWGSLAREVLRRNLRRASFVGCEKV